MLYSHGTVTSRLFTSGNPVLLAPTVQGEVFIEQIMGGVYMYDHANKLFIFLGDIDHDTVEDLSRFLEDKIKKY